MSRRNRKHPPSRHGVKDPVIPHWMFHRPFLLSCCGALGRSVKAGWKTPLQQLRDGIRHAIALVGSVPPLLARGPLP
jgi:hypothetical protein